jgi:peptidoglycan/xylan/chitin deacetylase (PgdA/CDA1 family)
MRRSARIGIGLGCLALAGAAFALWRLVNSPTYQVMGEIVPRVATTRLLVALTFDDGPTEDGVETMLAMLANVGVRATFFVTGADLERRMDDLRATLDGRERARTHGCAHPRGGSPWRDPLSSALRKEARRAAVLLAPDLAADSNPITDAERIAAKVVTSARPGSIVLLHVMIAGREPSRQAVPKIVEGLRRRGFDFVTVSELLALRRDS